MPANEHVLDTLLREGSADIRRGPDGTVAVRIPESVAQAHGGYVNLPSWIFSDKVHAMLGDGAPKEAGGALDALLSKVELDAAERHGAIASVGMQRWYAKMFLEERLAAIVRALTDGLRGIGYAEGDGPTRSWDEPFAADAARATLANAEAIAKGES